MWCLGVKVERSPSVRSQLWPGVEKIASIYIRLNSKQSLSEVYYTGKVDELRCQS